jgi:hypothetical protein
MAGCRMIPGPKTRPRPQRGSDMAEVNHRTVAIVDDDDCRTGFVAVLGGGYWSSCRDFRFPSRIPEGCNATSGMPDLGPSRSGDDWSGTG